MDQHTILDSVECRPDIMSTGPVPFLANHYLQPLPHKLDTSEIFELYMSMKSLLCLVARSV